MPHQPSRCLSGNRSRLNQAVIPILLLALAGLAGCGHHFHAKLPVDSVPRLSPRPPAVALAAAPEIRAVSIADPPALVAGPPESRRNLHRGRNGDEGDDSAGPRPPAPQMSPQIPPGNQAALQEKTIENIAAAEQNLRLVQGRNLNSSQMDLAEKIRGFLAQAREAMSAPDWARAELLSQKAYLLSGELIRSL